MRPPRAPNVLSTCSPRGQGAMNVRREGNEAKADRRRGGHPKKRRKDATGVSQSRSLPYSPGEPRAAPSPGEPGESGTGALVGLERGLPAATPTASASDRPPRGLVIWPGLAQPGSAWARPPAQSCGPWLPHRRALLKTCR